MSTTLRYRLFGMGKMPPGLRDAAAGSGVLLAAEGISVKQSVRQLRIPRASVGQGTKFLIGSVVLLPDRVLASIGTHTILDVDFSHPGRADQTLALASDGVRIAFDVASVLAGGSGSVEVHYRVSVAATALAQLPSPCRVDLLNATPALLSGWTGTKAT